MNGHPSQAIYFLSDYGTVDEFVGVVRAVLYRLAPAVPVIDLSHEVPPFDVGSGAAMLVRCAPHLGAGVVLGVVDPGVGTARGALAIRIGAERERPTGPTTRLPAPIGPRWLVGPDNGLLTPMAEALGGADMAIALGRADSPLGGTPPDRRGADAHRSGPSFDGRDLFAPAAAHLAIGGDPAVLGPTVDPAALVPGAEQPHGSKDRGSGAGEGRPGGTGPLETSVMWIDRYGNVQLRLPPEALEGIGLRPGDMTVVTLATGSDVDRGVQAGRAAGAGDTRRRFGHSTSVRWVRTFGELAGDELGLIVDANGQMALVLDRASAAGRLGLSGTGREVRILLERAEER